MVYGLSPVLFPSFFPFLPIVAHLCSNLMILYSPQIFFFSPVCLHMLDSLPDSVSSMAPSSQLLFIPQALIQISLLQDAFVDCLRILCASLSSHRTSHSSSIYHIWLSTLISL